MSDINELILQIESAALDDKFTDVYRDINAVGYQRDRYINALTKFSTYYKSTDVNIFSAPGRSEVMGNHTDHQHGEVLAAGINLDAIAIVGKTEGKLIRIVSGPYPMMKIDIGNLNKQKSKKASSEALVEGICKYFFDRGFEVGGFDAYITSDVIVGAGLSSSAAFETLIGTIVSHLFNGGIIKDTEIAIAGQYAENVYFGKPCGLMDQMACSLGGLVHVDFADESNPVSEKIMYDLSDNGYSLCITDTKGSHANLTDEYAAIPKEMKEVASFFGREYLLGVTLDELLANASKIRAQFSDRALLRAIHFVNENERVKKGVAALKNNDTNEFLKLIRESGKSSFEYLQNVYAVNDYLNQNLSLALAISDSILDKNEEAFRVHGGGFAGTIQAFVKNENVGVYKEKLDAVFGENSCHVLNIRKYGGIRIV